MSCRHCPHCRSPETGLFAVDIRDYPVFIYTLSDPDGVVRYVGRSSHPEQRLKNHMEMGARAVSRWVRDLRRCKQKPVLRIFCRVEPGHDSAREERRAIAHCLMTGWPLLNRVRNDDILKEACADRGILYKDYDYKPAEYQWIFPRKGERDAWA